MKKSLSSIGILICFFILSAICSFAATGEVDRAVNSPSVVVEVFGYGTLDIGESIADAHREALEDALKNAVVQAHVSLDVQIQVDDMRLKKSSIRSRSRGYVEHSRVLDAGVIPDSDPLVYQVHMEARVRPLAHFSQEYEPSSDGVINYQPVVTLVVYSTQGTDHEIACKKILSEFLQECGIQVVDAEQDSSVLVVNVTLAQSSTNGVWKLQWKMAREKIDHVAEFHARDTVHGDWEIPASDSKGFLELDRLGVVLSKDAFRLWLEPQFYETNYRINSDR